MKWYKGFVVSAVAAVACFTSGCFDSEKTAYFTAHMGDDWRVVEDQSVFNQSKTSFVYAYYPNDKDTGIKVSISVDQTDGETTGELTAYTAKMIRMAGAIATTASEGNNIYSIRFTMNRPSGETTYSKCYLRSNGVVLGSICLTAKTNDLSEAEYFVSQFDNVDTEVMPFPLPTQHKH